MKILMISVVISVGITMNIIIIIYLKKIINSEKK